MALKNLFVFFLLFSVYGIACQESREILIAQKSSNEIIGNWAFECQSWNDTIDNLAYYRALLLGGSLVVGAMFYSRYDCPKTLEQTLWQYGTTYGGLCASWFLSLIIDKLQHRVAVNYEQPVIKLLEQLDNDEQNELIKSIERKNEMSLTTCHTAFSVSKWLRECQQEAYSVVSSL